MKQYANCVASQLGNFLRVKFLCVLLNLRLRNTFVLISFYLIIISYGYIAKTLLCPS